VHDDEERPSMSIHVAVNPIPVFLRPNHKMLLDLNAQVLPPYEKLKAEYKI
jgi:hypothetical protein